MSCVKPASKIPVIRLDASKVLGCVVIVLLIAGTIIQYLEEDALAVFAFEITSRVK